MDFKGLIDYKDARIESLQTKVCEMESRIQILETYIIEMADPACPDDYKKEIRSIILNSDY